MDEAEAPRPQQFTFPAHDVATAMLNAWRDDVGRLGRRIASLEDMNVRLMKQLADNAKQLREAREVNDVVSEECARLRASMDTDAARITEVMKAKIAEIESPPVQHVVLPPSTFGG